MQIKANIPSFLLVKSFFSQLSVIALIYFVVAVFGTYFLVYIDASKFFEFSAIAIAAVAAIKYGWAGVFGAALGSLCFRLVDIPLEPALYFALSAGCTAFLFQFSFNWFHPKVVTLNHVTSVASFALVITPVLSALHTISAYLTLQKYQLIATDLDILPIFKWWLDELLIAYLIVPLVLSLFANKYTYLSIKERTEMSALLLGMVAVTWLTTQFGQLLGFTVILILILLVFVLWAAIRFSYTVAHVAILIAAMLVMMIVLTGNNTLNPEPYQQTLMLVKISLAIMILGGLFVAAAFSERNHVETELSKLANHDPLTDLPNRTYFQHFLNHSISHAQRQKQQLYLLFIDLDRFKKLTTHKATKWATLC